jgi:2,3-dihydroxy-p-cumate/2,3-dihydroxybenzoate 3,4-dioxygenase
MIRYKKLSRVDLWVTDLERSREFYERVVGLELVSAPDENTSSFRCSDDHVSLRLLRGRVAGLKAAAWELEDSDQFPALLDALTNSGTLYSAISEEECRQFGISRGYRATEPTTGATLEFFTGSRIEIPSAYKPSIAKIQRLGHVVYASAAYEDTVRFFHETLNFLPSDAVEERITFMRSFPSPYHHGIGVAKSEKNHLHHLNFMVTEIDDVGRLHTRLKQCGVPIVYGPGRHPISDSIFLYFLDPDGITLEYSFGMEEFSEVSPREPRLLPRRPEWSDSWGSAPTNEWGKVGTL